MAKITTIILVILVTQMFLIVPASAAIILPDSSYLDGTWQGNKEYFQDGFKMLVEWAVYDTQGGNEFVTEGFTAPGDGRYIYAYQVFQSLQDGFTDVKSFAIFATGENILQESAIKGLSSQDDKKSGIATIAESFDTEESQVVWEFESMTLIKGKHSYFLVFSSDLTPVAGDFTIKSAADNDSGPPPVPTHNPEPATMALLACGSVLLARRKRINRC